MKKHLHTLAVIVIGGALSVYATGCEPARHCEHDATDAQVDQRHCQNNENGYEWEDDGFKSKNHKKSKSRTRRR